MDNRTSLPFACRYCQHYQFEGRRGGQCEKLGAPVKGEWQSCSLMKPSLPTRPTPKLYGLKIQKYVSDIHSYETAAQLKPSPSRSQIAS